MSFSTRDICAACSLLQLVPAAFGFKEGFIKEDEVPNLEKISYHCLNIFSPRYVSVPNLTSISFQELEGS